jgi:hypothetical protein
VARLPELRAVVDACPGIWLRIREDDGRHVVCATFSVPEPWSDAASWSVSTWQEEVSVAVEASLEDKTRALERVLHPLAREERGDAATRLAFLWWAAERGLARLLGVTYVEQCRPS